MMRLRFCCAVYVCLFLLSGSIFCMKIGFSQDYPFNSYNVATISNEKQKMLDDALEQVNKANSKNKTNTSEINLSGQILVPDGKLFREGGDITISSKTHDLHLTHIGSSPFTVTTKPNEKVTITATWKLKNQSLSCDYILVAYNTPDGKPVVEIQGGEQKYQEYELYCTPATNKVSRHEGLILVITVRGPRGNAN